MALIERTVAVIQLPSNPDGHGGGLLSIQGRSVLEWTVDAIKRVPEINDLAITNPAASRMAALRQALDVVPPCERILLHEANRPLTSPVGLRSFLREARGHPVAALVAPVKSTYKEVVDGRILSTIPRDQLFQLQQVLLIDRLSLEEAVSAALRRGWDGDEFALCEWAEFPIRLIPGQYFNFPVAAHTDVEFAERLIAKGFHLAL